MSQTPTTIESRMRMLLLGVIGGYRRWISPLLPRACRFYPSCSVYASAAIERHGVVGGARLTAARLLRCHPWCEGGIDHVPPVASSRHEHAGMLESVSAVEVRS